MSLIKSTKETKNKTTKVESYDTKLAGIDKANLNRLYIETNNQSNNSN